MFRPRASRRLTRPALATIFVLASAMPAMAASPSIVVTTVASPVRVTVGLPIAYVITVTNGTNNALKYAGISGQTSVTDQTSVLPTFLFSEPSASCSQSEPSCVFDNLASGAAATATFVFRAPATPGTFNFTALSDFDGDTTNPNATHNDTVEKVIQTVVLATSQDLVMGYSLPEIRAFSTGGLDCALLGLPGNCEPGSVPLGTGNPHGTRVTVKNTVEVTVADLPPTDPAVACPTAIAATCFGWGSSLSIANGATVPGGIEVTMRWDLSELPKGMTEKKLRIAHLLGGQDWEPISNACLYEAGVPTNIPCISVPPFRLADKDIQATFFLLFNRVSRGY